MKYQPRRRKREAPSSPPTGMERSARRQKTGPVPSSGSFVPYVERRPRPDGWRGSCSSKKAVEAMVVSQETSSLPLLRSIHEENPTASHTHTLSGTSRLNAKFELRLSFTASISGDTEERKYPNETRSHQSYNPRPGDLLHKDFGGTPLPRKKTYSATQKVTPNAGRSLEYISDPFTQQYAQFEDPNKYPHDRPIHKKLEQSAVVKAQTEFTIHSPQTFNDRLDKSPQSPFIPNIPIITPGPKPKPEGFGFTFSESLFYDSDEYPPTECTWSPNFEQDVLKDTPSTFNSPPLLAQDSSFADNVVLRDVGSFHLAKPQKALPCTDASREDTVALKYAAKELNKYLESEEICGELLGRVERMVTAIAENENGRVSLGSVTVRCAVKLWEFLVRIRDDRVETGESKKLVEHEIAWAKWMVDAARKGVLHIKTQECRCRPGWEE